MRPIKFQSFGNACESVENDEGRYVTFIYRLSYLEQANKRDAITNWKEVVWQSARYKLYFFNAFKSAMTTTTNWPQIFRLQEPSKKQKKKPKTVDDRTF